MWKSASGAVELDEERATAQSVLVERVRQSLLDGVLVPGSRVNEVHLSRSLGTSRTPLRAALQMLAGEGLLQYTPNKGFTVRAFALSELVDSYEMRARAEGLAARLAAERGLDEASQIALEDALARGDDALADGSDPRLARSAYAEANERFHTTIHAAARSELVKDVVRLCQRVPQSASHNVMEFEIEDVRLRHAAHHRIYEAIICREPREAENQMMQHILSVKISMVRAFARQRAADSDPSQEAGSAQRRAPVR